MASYRRRTGRAGDHLIHPDDEAVASDEGHRDEWPDDESESQEYQDLTLLGAWVGSGDVRAGDARADTLLELCVMGDLTS